MKDTTPQRSRRVALSLLSGSALLGAAALMAYGSGVSDANSAPTETVGDKAIAAVPNAAASNMAPQDASRFHPSPYSSLMVRSVPATTPASQSEMSGSIYLKPGVPRSAFRPPVAIGRRGTRIVRGRSAAGGTIYYTDPSSMPYATAEVKKNGSVVLHCEENGKSHSLQEHRAHQSKPSNSAAGQQRKSVARQ